MIPQSRLAELTLILLTLVWGGTFVIVKDALNDVSTIYFLALRFTLGALALLLFFGSKLRRASPRQLRWPAAAGLLLTAGYWLQTEGLKTTTAGKSVFLTSLYIVLVPLFGCLVYRSGYPRIREWIGVALAFSGVAFMTVDPGSALRWTLGDLLTIGCAAVFALHILVMGEAARSGDAALAGLVQIGLAAALFWMLLPTERPFFTGSPRVLTALAITGILATAVALTAQVWAQQFVPPARAALLFALEPVFGGLAAWWWAGESFTRYALAGAALILAGIILVESKSADVQPGAAEKHPLSGSAA